METTIFRKEKSDMALHFDYSKLRGRIIEKYNSLSAFAKVLEISNQTLSQKLNCTRRFNLEEMVRIAELLEIEQDEFGIYFFTIKSS